MHEITDITAVEVLDSRGKPTLSVSVHAGDHAGTFAVPSGASTGSSEACELRDADGHMAAAIANIETIIKPALVGHDVADQRWIDDTMRTLDGTENKSHLGGNALIGVSIAAARSAARAQGIETYAYLRTLADIPPARAVPFLYSNYVNGGKHARSPLSFQEHILVPDTESVHEAMQMIETTGDKLEALIRARYGDEAATSMGDEGGYVIPESDPHAPFALLAQAIKEAGYDGRIRIATDIAASSFYADGVYTVGGAAYDAAKLADLYRELVAQFPIVSIEDPFFEDAFDDFARLQASIEPRIVGDDLTVTNVKRLERAIEGSCIRALIVKPNQIGTLSETLDTMKLAREHGIDCIVSHRSGETTDDFIADLAFAFGVFGLKAGALRKPERRIKYERLAAISAT